MKRIVILVTDAWKHLSHVASPDKTGTFLLIRACADNVTKKMPPTREVIDVWHIQVN